MEAPAELRGNMFAVPYVSSVQPLRSVLLDPKINTYPACRTQSELRRQRKRAMMPHMSFDIDGDGEVSQLDLKLAKQFDANKNGMLDPKETHLGRQVIAKDFFEKHKKDYHLYGNDWSGDPAENARRPRPKGLVGPSSCEGL